MKSLIQKVKDYFLETDTNPKKDQPAAWEHKSESSDLKPKAPKHLQLNSIPQKSSLKSEL